MSNPNDTETRGPLGSTPARAILEVGRCGSMRITSVSESRQLALIDGWWRGDRTDTKPTKPGQWRILAVAGEVADGAGWPS